ncbi:hypothetical protein K504DRAFT_536537 [Pleomassaria siparia CBS 279.74]|uniref:Uncharacterized protein n=1 Tax=Pleomassaria siparia CBS 279.74 TaxID=1314801 RepID=A0A6G1K1I4_9PLEO|nr:hypothetical protein K504DRAFT_536537 [Pleomassaria siparia CBS 279.74]
MASMRSRASTATRNMRATSIASTYSVDSRSRTETPGPSDSAKKDVSSNLPPHYLLRPTYPNPFDGGIECSLDDLLSFAKYLPEAGKLMRMLLQGGEAAKSAKWKEMLEEILALELPRGTSENGGNGEDVDMIGVEEVRQEEKRGKQTESQGQKPGRVLLIYILLLFIRTLLPRQITENRAYLVRVYTEKRNTASRLILRYDMLLHWKKPANHYLVVASPEPTSTLNPLPVAPPPVVRSRYPPTRHFMPNILPTLIAAPVGGFQTKAIGERMRHHITELDTYLLLREEQIEGWANVRLMMTLSTVISLWSWLRVSNEKLEAMEVHGWEELGGIAEENMWFLQEVKEEAKHAARAD